MTGELSTFCMQWALLVHYLLARLRSRMRTMARLAICNGQIDSWTSIFAGKAGIIGIAVGAVSGTVLAASIIGFFLYSMCRRHKVNLLYLCAEMSPGHILLLSTYWCMAHLHSTDLSFYWCPLKWVCARSVSLQDVSLKHPSMKETEVKSEHISVMATCLQDWSSLLNMVVWHASYEHDCIRYRDTEKSVSIDTDFSAAWAQQLTPALSVMVLLSIIIVYRCCIAYAVLLARYVQNKA